MILIDELPKKECHDVAKADVLRKAGCTLGCDVGQYVSQAFAANDFYYVEPFRCNTYDKYKAVQNWGKEMLHEDWSWFANIIVFKNPEDALLYKLTWI